MGSDKLFMAKVFRVSLATYFSTQNLVTSFQGDVTIMEVSQTKGINVFLEEDNTSKLYLKFNTKKAQPYLILPRTKIKSGMH